MAIGSPLEFAPWSLVTPHLERACAFLLDRGRGRLSFAGSCPVAQLVVEHDGQVREFRGERWKPFDIDPIDAISSFVDAAQVATDNGLPDALAGLDVRCLPRTVGYLAYELGIFSEPASAPATARVHDTLGTPLAVLSTYAAVDVWDPRSASITHVRFPGHENGVVTREENRCASRHWQETSRAAYRRGFETIQRAIRAGEIYQANLSRRIVTDLKTEPAALYARLREAQPVPHGAFLDCGGFELLSNSPETFLIRDGDRIVTRPIKGTRPRGHDRAGDARLRDELLADPKENAEHLMIVDLERNDLGRIARTGSVEVTHFAEIESFATVHHMVSEVSAELRAGVDLAAVLRATFPGGSITGAPKIRAMELLADVEENRRGPYCGAIGFFNGSRCFELSIAIRTALTCRGRAMYSAGGGIVADSDCEREWEETEAKAAAFRACLDSEGASAAAAGS